MENNEKVSKEQSIVSFVAQKVKEGVSSEEIKNQLHAVGWSDGEIEQAYASGLAEAGIPVPVSGDEKIFSKKSSVAEIIVNIFSFVVLGAIAISLGVLLFQVIGHYFKDPFSEINYYGSRKISTSAIHYSIAVLIVSFPMYYFSMRFWFKKFREDEGRVESRLTKWITYIVLLAVAVTIVGDLIAVLFGFLQGEMTTRFFLKALTILVISGGIFGFYYLERKKVQHKKPIPRKTFQAFGLVTALVILVSIILGLFVAGSPATARKRAFDNERSRNLQSLARCIEDHAQANGELPESLAFVDDTSSYLCRNIKVKDPETEEAYEYNVIANPRGGAKDSLVQTEFELCANFSLVSDENDIDSQRYYYNGDNKWDLHESGRSCDKQSVIIRAKDPKSTSECNLGW